MLSAQWKLAEKMWRVPLAKECSRPQCFAWKMSKKERLFLSAGPLNATPLGGSFWPHPFIHLPSEDEVLALHSGIGTHPRPSHPSLSGLLPLFLRSPIRGCHAGHPLTQASLFCRQIPGWEISAQESRKDARRIRRLRTEVNGCFDHPTCQNICRTISLSTRLLLFLPKENSEVASGEGDSGRGRKDSHEAQRLLLSLQPAALTSCQCPALFLCNWALHWLQQPNSA